jgi:hypothetical protein
MRREELYLRDIVEAADHIAGFIAGLAGPLRSLKLAVGPWVSYRVRRTSRRSSPSALADHSATPLIPCA